MSCSCWMTTATLGKPRSYETRAALPLFARSARDPPPFSLMGVHGEPGRVLTDNGGAWNNEHFRGMLANSNIAREHTVVDGPKDYDRRVQRRIELVAEGAKKAFTELLKHFPDVVRSQLARCPCRSSGPRRTRG